MAEDKDRAAGDGKEVPVDDGATGTSEPAEPKPAKKATKKASERPVQRAGGHVNRHDGKGWVVETKKAG